MLTTTTENTTTSEIRSHVGPLSVISASMPTGLIREVDKIRGDIPRSLWLRLAAQRELQRQKKIIVEKEMKEEEEQTEAVIVS